MLGPDDARPPRWAWEPRTSDVRLLAGVSSWNPRRQAEEDVKPEGYALPGPGADLP